MIHRPSIGRYTKLEEPKAQESLLVRRSSSKSSLLTTGSSATLAPSTVSVNTPAVDGAGPSPSFSPFPMVSAANAALMERTPFAIDDAGDDDDSDDDSDRPDDDDQVLDEVRSFDL